MGLKQTSAPSVEPVTTAEAKSHLRVDISDDDTLIAELIKAARQLAEAFTRRQFITATYELKTNELAEIIALPRPPLQSVTSIKYVDTSGDTQTASSSLYGVDTHAEPGRIILAHGQTWPTVRDEENAVTITYKAGYGDAGSDVPEALKAAIKLIVGDLYEHREARTEMRVEDNPTAARLLWAYRILEL